MIDKKELINTVKIALAAILAIIIANVLNLEFAVSAGIISILTIQPTKKETIQTALGRLYAFGIALVIALVCFEVLGFSVEAFFLYLILYILVCQKFHWYSAMAMNSVLISHFLTFSHMEISAIWNEILLFAIGVGIGVIANLHLHKKISYIEELKVQTDEQIKMILHRMSIRIMENDILDYNGECFQRLEESIRKAKNVAEENFKNQFGTKDIYDQEYILMRERQVHTLYEMYKKVRNLQTQPVTAKLISDFLEQVSKDFHEENTVKKLLEEFNQMNETMKSKPLPVTRAEFEDRAKLYGLLRDIEEFLKIKQKFYDTVGREKIECSSRE